MDIINELKKFRGNEKNDYLTYSDMKPSFQYEKNF